jgi:hypothetical protein
VVTVSERCVKCSAIAPFHVQGCSKPEHTIPVVIKDVFAEELLQLEQRLNMRLAAIERLLESH